MLKRLLIIGSIVILTGCGDKYARTFGPPDPGYAQSGNLYQNTAFNFILIKPNYNWTYTGTTAGLIKRDATSTIARFTREISPTVTAFLEVDIWDVTDVVTPGMFTMDLISRNVDLIIADTERFPLYSAVTSFNVFAIPNQTAYEHQFQAWTTPNEVTAVQYRYSCVSFREQGEDYDRLFVFLGGTSQDDWASRSAEIGDFIKSFYFTE
jgi:hypothetical protein